MGPDRTQRLNSDAGNTRIERWGVLPARLNPADYRPAASLPYADLSEMVRPGIRRARIYVFTKPYAGVISDRQL